MSRAGLFVDVLYGRPLNAVNLIMFQSFDAT